MTRSTTVRLVLFAVLAFGFATAAQARNPIRNTFFSIYPSADGTQLNVLPSDASHCGVCHFDFAGGGPRNPYGLAIEVGRNNGLTDSQAILAVEGLDSDSDGYTNLTEITSTLFTNTPTFPGLSAGNVGNVVNIPQGEVTPYLTPAGATDTTPPSVTVLGPNGGEVLQAGEFSTVTYAASDASGISHIEIYYWDDVVSEWTKVADNEPNSGSFSWFVENLPETGARIRVEAYDNAGNEGHDDSDADFTVLAQPGIAPTTLRDMKLTGTQPFEGPVMDDPSNSCVTCHGNYNTAVEPWFNWRGSMMAHAQRDPLFLACLAVAEQDAPSVGDLCLRCHTPGGWMEGRSADTGGGLVNAKDRQGVHCDYCHRLVDLNYVPGVSPLQDQEVLNELEEIPLQYGNGQHIADPAPLRRGPYADADASHEFVESPFHRSSDICGTCHDVSSPVYQFNGPGDYTLTAMDTQHPDFDLRNMMPIERTFSEWSNSEYATTGVYAPQFAGAKLDGIVSTCQDCHMRDVVGKGSNQNSPNRDDLGLHDLTGGNHFIPDILDQFFPGEVNNTELQAGKQRAIDMLQLAATLDVAPTSTGVDVRVWNETGHKLPSGYPEGRRIWLYVRGFQADGTTVYESGAYDVGTGVLTHDDDLKIYEIHPGLSQPVADALGLPSGPSFHFVLNDSVFMDTRIPPRGFTNAAFEAIQSEPVDYVYADGQYWDDTVYDLPASCDSAQVILYYQSTSKEYVEFLRDENHTNSAGDDLYNAWVAQGKAAPVVMASATVPVSIDVTSVPGERGTLLPFELRGSTPNPFVNRTQIAYTVPEPTDVRLEIFDIQGRRVKTLVDDAQLASRYEIAWDGRDDRGGDLASGVYFVRYRAGDRITTQRLLKLK